MNHLIQVTKADGTQELFEEEKLVNSLRRVHATPQTIDEIVENIGMSMKPGMTTSEIYHQAFSLLRRHSAPVAVKYSIRRALLELGPDGFPFEKFIARIFRMWGYETLTDQEVMGACVSHEIDVVAWKGESLAMVEAKFHNGIGLSSDIKVALYVKARFDDISANNFDYGGTVRKLTERWLITNTKFTDRAIHYGECQKLKMIGWNYPAKQDLHNIIEQNGLHPITCLISLTRDQKRDLIGRNILACSDLLKEPEVLHAIGTKLDVASAALEEARTIVESAK
ncbi:MAG: ATP cone domain-containing protein [Patescibacteria group bacterium]